MTGEYKTFDEWKSEGRYIDKGQKSHKRCVFTGKALFEKGQTYKNTGYRYESEHGDEYPDWDDLDTWASGEY